MGRPQKLGLIALVVVLLIAAAVVGTLLGRDGGGSDSADEVRTPSTSGSVSPSASPAPSASSSPPSSAGGAPDPDLAGFYSQTLHWSSCRSGDQCAKLRVPLDYGDPQGRAIELAVLKVPATDPSARVGSLVVDPGGPGAPATDYAVNGGWGQPLRQHFDIVGMDPRGVGESDPIDCVSDRQLDAYLALEPVPDTPAEVKDYTGWSNRMGRGCVAKSGDLAGHVSTVEAARDMDILRAAVGDKQLNYFGASYGTKLGTVYADLFPGKVGRFVLDGAIDPSVAPRAFNLAQAHGFEVALRAYVGHCIDEGDCFLGDSIGAGVKRVQQILAQVDAHPLQVGNRTVTGGNALFGVIMPLYSRSLWPYLDQALKGARQGDGSVLLAMSDLYADRGPSGYSDNSVEANWAINCLDDPTSYTPAQVEKALPDFRKASPTFGPAVAWMMAGCAGETKRAAEPLPPVGAPGANPIVVIGTTRDPATPYAWAKSLAAQLDSGVLVSRDGDGHTGYNQGNTCVNHAVESYLVDGRAPKNGLSC